MIIDLENANHCVEITPPTNNKIRQQLYQSQAKLLHLLTSPEGKKIKSLLRQKELTCEEYKNIHQ